MQVTTIGVDLAKNVFQVHDIAGNAQFKSKVSCYAGAIHTGLSLHYTLKWATR